jgi:crossover junction endodeoxyribonuclease RuvC
VSSVLVLGIDPGTIHLGWGVVERRGPKLVHIGHGVIHARPSESLSDRLAVIAAELERVIAEHRPALGSVEQLFFHKDPQAAAKLGHARGVVLLSLARAGVPLREHAPARIKRTLTGNGRAEKSQVAQMVSAILGIREALPPDASDALAIAITELRLDPLTPQVVQKPRRTRSKTLPPHVTRLVRAP